MANQETALHQQDLANNAGIVLRDPECLQPARPKTAKLTRTIIASLLLSYPEKVRRLAFFISD